MGRIGHWSPRQSWQSVKGPCGELQFPEPHHAVPVPPRDVHFLAPHESLVSQLTQTPASVTDRHLCVLGHQRSSRSVVPSTHGSQDASVGLWAACERITTRDQFPYTSRLRRSATMRAPGRCKQRRQAAITRSNSNTAENPTHPPSCSGRNPQQRSHPRWAVV